MKKRLVIMPDNTQPPDNYDYFIYVGDGYGKRNNSDNNKKRDYSEDSNYAEVHSIKVYNSIYTQKFKILSIFRKKE